MEDHKPTKATIADATLRSAPDLVTRIPYQVRKIEDGMPSLLRSPTELSKVSNCGLIGGWLQKPDVRCGVSASFTVSTLSIAVAFPPPTPFR